MQTWQELRQTPSLWHRYFIREQTIKTVRSFFDAQGFHEVETPILLLHPPAESYIEVFETTLLNRHRQGKTAYLSTSPETALKKLLVAGIGNCYSITKSFRNTEGESSLHQPEFTILEWYRVEKDYMALMKDCEHLLLTLTKSICNVSPKNFSYQGKTIDLTPPWERLSMKEAFARYAHIDLEKFFDMKQAMSIANQKGYTTTPQNTWEELFNQIFLNEIEPRLGKTKPTILYDFPSAMAALAKKKNTNPQYAERFEFYIGGLELGDCYTELTDWKEQQDRFDEEMKKIQHLGKTQYTYDHDFINALKEGMPPCAGIAVGLDRLIMLLSDVKTIQETMFFPL